MDRRSVIQVVTGTAIAHSLVSVAGCKATSPAESADGTNKHEGHDHAKMAAMPEGGASEALKELARLASGCVVAGDACLEHCLRMLSTGDTSMADCSRQAQQMLPICRAMASLAAMGSEYASEMARLCAVACEACAKICEPHAAHHAECAACMAACQKTSAAARALT